MSSSSTITLPPGALLHKAQAVARAARREGGRAFLVGGYVRDALLGLSPKDADMEVYGLEAPVLRRVLERLGHVNCVGESFRVYKLVWRERASNPNASGADMPSVAPNAAAPNAAAPNAVAPNAVASAANPPVNPSANPERHELDVSLPRRDRKTGEGHRGFEVEGDPNASFEDACRRRDFTINALLCDPLDGVLIDPFGGALDLENRVLRAVDPLHFGEDSLRVLRAVQFAARFGMQVEPQTIALCRAIDLGDLPRERIWGEWEKLLLKSARPSLGLQAARELGVLELFPALSRAMSTHETALCLAFDRAARERDLLGDERADDVFENRTDTSREDARREEQIATFKRAGTQKQIALMLATLGAFFSESDETLTLLATLGIQTIAGYNVRSQVSVLSALARLPARHYEAVQRGETVSEGHLRRLVLHCEPRLLFHLARALGHEDAAAWFLKRMRELDVEFGPPAPLLLGRHLLEMGLEPGPRIGQITRAVYEMQLDGIVSTHARALEAARAMIAE